jgi:hypothetical protein
MKYVFEQKHSKESSVEEFKELFQEKSEEIVNTLWNLTEKIYNIGGSSDLLEEIYKDKSEKKYPTSQIVNPNAEHKGKHIFNSAINDVRGDRDKGRRKGSEGSSRYDDDRRHGKKDELVKTYTVNDKKVVIRKRMRSRSRSRSRSNEKERERQQRFGEQGEGKHEQQETREYKDNKFGNDYYMPRGGYYPRGRGGFKRGFRGQQFMMMPRYMEPRR